MVEWRYILSHGSIAFDVELAPYHHEGGDKLPAAGILSLKFQLSPFSKLNKAR
jgi:hypothetical protein